MPSLGVLIHKISEKVLGQHPKNALLGQLILNWSGIVGPDIAAKTRPQKIVFSTKPHQKEGVFYIEVHETLMLSIRYALPLYLERINQHLGYKAFDRIVLRKIR
jgi:hypothetical protein